MLSNFRVLIFNNALVKVSELYLVNHVTKTENAKKTQRVNCFSQLFKATVREHFQSISSIFFFQIESPCYTLRKIMSGSHPVKKPASSFRFLRVFACGVCFTETYRRERGLVAQAPSD